MCTGSYRLRVVSFILILMSFGLGGCATTDSNRTRAEGAAAGAAVGAAIGYSAGKNSTLTLLGATLGAVVGYVVGDGVAQEKTTYAQQEQHLTQLADKAKKRTAETAELNRKLQQEIVSLQKINRRLDSQLLALSERNRLVTARSVRTNELLRQTNQQIAVVNQDLVSLRKEITQAQSVVQKEGAPGQPEPSVSLQLVANQTTALENQRQALAHAAAQLQLIDTRRD
ncbi:MAG TPA: glycine zipper domain-containing protein [Accumulibacter sp.]|nr:glycine zipper domain-containing protein [Accumulibacter sp.]HNC18141.1 glycine zipper domain-containing protein [Accumulibacter sp.]HNE13377.1 glycine zipper domain-containing protein [Accumulibacter sp.]HNI72289.1 glycine zipper domain-containing protein [Accumulibacter sp.]HNK00974.1 glycine zipper domain-containing protein [Accumulibacter sp.]